MGALCCPEEAVVPREELGEAPWREQRTDGPKGQVLTCTLCGQDWLLARGGQAPHLAFRVDQAALPDDVDLQAQRAAYLAEFGHRHGRICIFQGCQEEAVRGSSFCRKHPGSGRW